jgi:hypothetical protein
VVSDRWVSGLWGSRVWVIFFFWGSEIFERKMPPKKREKEPETSKHIRMDQIQADHELFLQAFESK